MIAIKPADLALVREILDQHIPGVEVRAFGSRVTGSARAYSDLDLAIVSDDELPIMTLALLKDDFRESDLPIKVDVCEWRDLPESIRQSPFERLTPI